MHHRRNPSGDLPHDDDLAQWLSAALRAEAGGVTPPADAWPSHQARLGGTGDAGPGPARAAAPRGRGPRWRIPLIAAAAVAAIAITTTAIITHRPGIPNAGSVGGTAATCAVVPGSASIVPVDTSNGEQVAPAVGVAADSSTAPSADALSPGDPDVTMRMFFANGAPPEADLCGIFSDRGGPPAASGPHSSDGTAVGYLSIFGAASNSMRYLWGAVGPAVAQLQVNAIVPPDPRNIDPGFTSGPMWVIDSGHGTRWSLPEAATTVWTDVGDGWHGFAVQIPANATEVDAIALDRTGTPAQNRILDLSTGKSSDGPLPQPTGTIAPAPTTRPQTGAGSAPAAPASTARASASASAEPSATTRTTR